MNTDNHRFAIADGVSKSFFPDYWADILVNNFIAIENNIELSIEKCQAEWLEKINEKVSAPNVKWYTKNAFIKQESGLATFVGLRFENDKWFANALGDSFLFFLPNGKVGFDEWIKLSSKPLPVVFDSFPDYFSSRNKQHGKVKSIEHTLVEGTFYLMTDALAEWVFCQQEKAIEEITGKWHSQDEFERSVTELRLLNFLNNDDSAILIIEIKDDEKTKLSYDNVEIQSLSKLAEKEKSAEENPVEYKKESFIEVVKSEIATKDSVEDIKTENSTEEKTKSLNQDTVNQLLPIEQFNQSQSIFKIFSKRKAETKTFRSNKFNKAKKNFTKELNKLKPEKQKEELNNLCKEYGISFKN